jgi:hypothetical protein
LQPQRTSPAKKARSPRRISAELKNLLPMTCSRIAKLKRRTV